MKATPSNWVIGRFGLRSHDCGDHTGQPRHLVCADADTGLGAIYGADPFPKRNSSPPIFAPILRRPRPGRARVGTGIVFSFPPSFRDGYIYTYGMMEPSRLPGGCRKR